MAASGSSFSRRGFLWTCCGLLLVFTLAAGLVARGGRQFVTVVVGSKEFPESYLLGEILRYLALDAGGHVVRHVASAGGTDVLWTLLTSGQIDVYVEYWGTLEREIFFGDDRDQILGRLATRGLKISDDLGFENPYALGMLEARAGDLRNTSQLAARSDLHFGLSGEFLARRGDGFGRLQEHYDLTPASIRGMTHAEAYEELKTDQIQVTDVYLTDAEVKAGTVRWLQDDQGFFPSYEAHLIYRQDLETRAPGVAKRFFDLQSAFTPETIAEMNRRITDSRTHRADPVKTQEEVAAFLSKPLGREVHALPWYRMTVLLRTTGEHLLLVFFSLGAALCAALPLSIWAVRHGWIRGLTLGIWLLPPPATLGLMRWLGSFEALDFLVGAPSALLVLFVYSLRPLVRWGSVGFRAQASEHGKLETVDLRLFRPYLLEGLRWAAVFNIGVAILGTLVDAGGYGGFIRYALALGEPALGLAGALPSMAMALLAWWLLKRLQGRLDPHFRPEG